MNNHTNNPVHYFWITIKLSTDFLNIQSYSCIDPVFFALLPTWFKSSQVLEKKRENRFIHRKVSPLLSTTNLK